MTLPDFKTALDLIKKGATLDAQEVIVSLREAHVSLREENIELREQIEALNTQLKNNFNIIYEEPFIWKIVDDEKEGPYCPLCYDKDQKLIRFQSSMREGLFICKSCKCSFKDSNYKQTRSLSAGEIARKMNR